MAAAAARSGQSVRALANDVEHRLGDLAARKFMALDVQARKFRENIAALFRNVKIDGFLRVAHGGGQGFSQARVTGRALAGIMERLFEPLNAGAAGAVGTVREGFGRIVLWALRVEGAFLAMQNAGLRALRMIGVQGGELRVSLAEIAGTVLLTMASLPILVVGRHRTRHDRRLHGQCTRTPRTPEAARGDLQGLQLPQDRRRPDRGLRRGHRHGRQRRDQRGAEPRREALIAAIREIATDPLAFARVRSPWRGGAAWLCGRCRRRSAQKPPQASRRMVDMSAADDAASAPVLAGSARAGPAR